MLSFTGEIRAYCAYTKRIDVLFFCRFFLKPKASKVNILSQGHGYELNILENGPKGGHFGGARRLLRLVSFKGQILAF